MKCKRAMYGVASIPGFFQKEMTNVLGDLKNAGVLLDDIIN